MEQQQKIKMNQTAQCHSIVHLLITSSLLFRLKGWCWFLGMFWIRQFYRFVTLITSQNINPMHMHISIIEILNPCQICSSHQWIYFSSAMKALNLIVRFMNNGDCHSVCACECAKVSESETGQTL